MILKRITLPRPIVAHQRHVDGRMHKYRRMKWFKTAGGTAGFVKLLYFNHWLSRGKAEVRLRK